MIKLGSKVKDSLTSFEGIAVTRTEHLYGCIHIGIQPDRLDKEGKPLETQYFDEQRIELLEEKEPEVSADSSAKAGGPSLYGRAPEPGE